MLVRLSRAGPSRPAVCALARRTLASPSPASQPRPSSSSSSAPSPSELPPPRTTPSSILRPGSSSGRPSLPAHFGSNQLVPVPEATLAQLSSIVGSFRAPIRYAFAYGSGIFSQASSPSLSSTPASTGKKPMLDFIFATTHADHFHSINLQQNPGHYPAYARLAGSEAVSWVQRKGGAGVWFNAFAEVEGAVRSACVPSPVFAAGWRGDEG